MDKEGYLHRIGRAGRFNTKGIAVNFVCKIGDEGQEKAYRKDVQVMEEIQKGLSASIPELPENFDSKQYIWFITNLYPALYCLSSHPTIFSS